MKDKRTERICLCYHKNKATELRPDQQLTLELTNHPDWKIITMAAAGHHYAAEDTLYVVFEYTV